MKTMIALGVATLLGATAMAQSTTGSSPMGPTTGSTPTDSTLPSPPPATSTDTTGSTAGMTASADGMTQGADGNWMMGERRATKAEIKAHKKSMTPK